MGALLTTALLAPPAPAQDRPAAGVPQDILALEADLEAAANTIRPSTVLIAATSPTGAMGYGSGVVIDTEGHILTCAHVVDFADEVEVTLANGRKLNAKRMGQNKLQDYALLKVKGGDHLTPCVLGDSDSVRLGDWVGAAGHPGGPYPDQRPAFAAGRVTGLHRRLPIQMVERYYSDAIRTDAPIFAGNSGGPLVDRQGHVVGLNGAILMLNENSYTVPINMIMKDLGRMQAGEEIAGVKPESTLPLPLEEFKGKDLSKFAAKFLREGLGGMLEGPNGEPNQMTRMVDELSETLENEDLIGALMDQLSGSEGEGDVDAIREALEGMLGGETPGGGDSAEMLRDMAKLFGEGGGNPDEMAEKMMRNLVDGFLGGGDNEGNELLRRVLDELTGPPPPPDAEAIERTLDTMSSAEIKELIETTDSSALKKMAREVGPDRLQEIVARLDPNDMQDLMNGPRGEEFRELMSELLAERARRSAPRPRPSASAPPKEPGFFGIRVDLDSPLQKRLRGVLVHEVVEGGPAASAGLLQGDLIVTVGALGIQTPTDFANALSGQGAGDRLRVTVLRDGEDGAPFGSEATLEVVLAPKGESK
jgi:S1-C subfamily serine protease